MMFKNLISRYPLAPWYLLALTVIAIVISVTLKPAVVPSIVTEEESEYGRDVETTIEPPIEMITLVGNSRVSENAADRKTITGQIFDTTDLIPLPGVSIEKNRNECTITINS